MAKTAHLEFAEWARKDLLEIARYIARNNPAMRTVTRP